MSQPHGIIWGFHYLNPDIFHSLSTLSTSIMSQPTRLTYFTPFFPYVPFSGGLTINPRFCWRSKNNKNLSVNSTPGIGTQRGHCRDKHPAKARGSVGQFTLAGFHTHGCWLWCFKWMFIPQKSIVFWCGLKKSSTCLEWLQPVGRCAVWKIATIQPGPWKIQWQGTKSKTYWWNVYLHGNANRAQTNDERSLKFRSSCLCAGQIFSGYTRCGRISMSQRWKENWMQTIHQKIRHIGMGQRSAELNQGECEIEYIQKRGASQNPMVLNRTFP